MRLNSMLATTSSTAPPRPPAEDALRSPQSELPTPSSLNRAASSSASTLPHTRSNSNVGTNGDSAATNGDISLDITSAAVERHVAESVSQELDYWEKLVFSFDMERDSGRQSGRHQQQQPSDAGSSAGASGRAGSSRRRTDQSQARGGPAPSGSGSGPSQQPLGSRHAAATSSSFPPIAPNIPGPFPPNLPAQQLNQLAVLDPYTLAHLAALSALQGQHGGHQAHQAPQHQQPPNPQSPSNLQDPSAVLRQYQSLLYPYGGNGTGGHTSPGRGSPMQGVGQGPGPGPSAPPQFQRFPSSGFGSRSGGAHQAIQPSLSESSSSQHHQRWPPQVHSMVTLPFPMPPLDPALASQLAQLSQSMTPGSGVYDQPMQTAGPSRSAAGGGARSRSRSTTSIGTGTSSTPVSPTASNSRGQSTLVDEGVIAEDKRRRNTLASARFRIKKKHKTLALERSVVELEARADDLEREASELRRENGWLKEMLIMKGRSVRAQAAAVKAELEMQDGDSSEEEEEEGEEGREEEGEGRGSGDEGEGGEWGQKGSDDDKGGGGGAKDVKGKGKERAT